MNDIIECIECGVELHAGTVCDECADEQEREEVAHLQGLINTGMAWRLEGAVGRECMRAIEDGRCMLGEQAHTDYWGNIIPSRYDVKPGTKGSPEYCQEGGQGLDG